MARRQLGAAPAADLDTATKAYVDNEISTIALTPGASGASGVPGASGEPGASGVPGASGEPGAAGAPGASGVPGASGQPGASGVPGASGAVGATGPAGPTTARTIQTITEPTTLGASGDHVTFCSLSGAAGDLSFTAVTALLHGEGANNSTTITDSSGLAANWTANGDAKITTAQAKFGSGSITFDGTGDFLTPTGSATNYTFGTSDFTIEMFVRPTTITGQTRLLYDGRASGAEGAYSTIYITSAGVLEYIANSSVRITGGTLSTNTWYHVALCRSGTSTRLFLNGTQVGSTYTDSTNYTVGTTRPRIGANGNSNDLNNFIGQMDEIRITKGVARYTANFTAPTAAFPDTLDDLLLGNPTLPGASGLTNLYTMKNINNVLSVTVSTTSGQPIDGATGGYTLTPGQIARFIPDGATGWRTL